MPRLPRLLRLKPLALGVSLILSPLAAVQAEPLGSAASSASSAGSASLGSISDSIQGSSRSSTGKNQVAEGRYEVTQVAMAPGKPDHRLLHLQAVAPSASGSGQVIVQVPVQALGSDGMQVGEAVQIRHRVYGLEFARAPQAGAAVEPFFLALDDAWHRQMVSRPVAL